MVKYGDKLRDSHKERLLNLTDVATSSLKDYHEQVQAGKLSLQEAQDLARQQIGQMRYDSGKGYFFSITDDPSHPVVTLHPIAKNLMGQDVGQYKKDGKIVTADSSSTPMFCAMVEECLNSADGQGYVGYQWPSPQNPAQWIPKLSYVKYFEPWGWIVGTGVYVDDIDREMTAKQGENNKVLTSFKQQTTEQTSAAMTQMFWILALLVTLGVGAIVVVARNITQPLHKIQQTARAIASGDLSHDAGMRRKDEIGALADSFEEMQTNLKHKTEVAEKISRGDLEINVKVAGEKDMLGRAMIRMIDSLKRVNDDLLSLSHAALEGNLSERADTTAHQGNFASIVAGINELLDAMVVPISEASDVLEKAAEKNLVDRMSGQYKGQFAEIKNNVNSTLHALDQALL